MSEISKDTIHLASALKWGVGCLWLIRGSRRAWVGADCKHGTQPLSMPQGSLCWWQARLLPVASALDLASSTPFYEVISVILIEKRLLSMSANFGLARKPIPAANLSKAKISF